MDKSGTITKQGVLINNEHYTEHFRDPKVWKEDGRYYMVLGVQTPELKGQMALYESDDPICWQHKGVIKTSYNDFGFMWECPDFFNLDNKAVMLFSPQGVESNSKYQFKSIYNVSYILGERLNSACQKTHEKPLLVQTGMSW